MSGVLNILEKLEVNTIYDEYKKLFLDTETNGLNIRKCLPFLIQLGLIHLNKLDINIVELNDRLEQLKDLFKKMINENYTFIGFNIKYDLNMLLNKGILTLKDLEKIKIVDVYIIFKIIMNDLKYHETHFKFSLKNLAKKFGVGAGDFYEKEIKSISTMFNKLLKIIIQDKKINIKDKLAYELVLDAVKNKQYEYDSTKNKYQISYEYIYKYNKELMVAYSKEDITLTYGLYQIGMKFIDEHKEYKKTLELEQNLTLIYLKQERMGVKIDCDYLIESKRELEKYYNELDLQFQRKHWHKDNENEIITCNMNAKILQFIKENYNAELESTDKKSLILELVTTKNKEYRDYIQLLFNLRKITKSLATYVERPLNKCAENNIWYEQVNQIGANTGRITSPLQQNPRDPLVINDKELFIPRKAILNRHGDYITYFLDYNAMELRMLAHYTLLQGMPDINLCRAYIPLGYINIHTNKKYNIKEDIFKIHDKYKGESIWQLDGKSWTPVDLHLKTAVKAFGKEILDLPEKQRNQKRTSGKTANFAKCYGAGKNGLMKQDFLISSCSMQQIINLNNAFNDTYPNIIKFMKEVANIGSKRGYVKNLYGRIYKIHPNYKDYSYKLCNYIVQGSCADILKYKLIEIDRLINENNYKSKIYFTVHDELIMLIHKKETEYLPFKIKEIMEDVDLLIPMISEIQYTKTNFYEKINIEV